MGHLVLWDHVLWSFVVGLTPLALGLAWKLLQCRRLDEVPTLADPRAGQAKEASLPSSLGQLSSTGPMAARPPATQIGGRPAPGSCLFQARW